jgi:hypothetical protein
VFRVPGSKVGLKLGTNFISHKKHKKARKELGEESTFATGLMLCFCDFLLFVAVYVCCNSEEQIFGLDYLPVFSFNASGTLSSPSPFVSSCLNCSVVPKNSLRDRSPSLFLSMLLNQAGAVGDCV